MCDKEQEAVRRAEELIDKYSPLGQAERAKKAVQEAVQEGPHVPVLVDGLRSIAHSLGMMPSSVLYAAADRLSKYWFDSQSKQVTFTLSPSIQELCAEIVQLNIKLSAERKQRVDTERQHAATLAEFLAMRTELEKTQKALAVQSENHLPTVAHNGELQRHNDWLQRQYQNLRAYVAHAHADLTQGLSSNG